MNKYINETLSAVELKQITVLQVNTREHCYTQFCTRLSSFYWKDMMRHVNILRAPLKTYYKYIKDLLIIQTFLVKYFICGKTTQIKIRFTSVAIIAGI